MVPCQRDSSRSRGSHSPKEQDMSPCPFSLFSSSSRRRKFRGTTMVSVARAIFLSFGARRRGGGGVSARSGGGDGGRDGHTALVLFEQKEKLKGKNFLQSSFLVGGVANAARQISNMSATSLEAQLGAFTAQKQLHAPQTAYHSVMISMAADEVSCCARYSPRLARACCSPPLARGLLAARRLAPAPAPFACTPTRCSSRKIRSRARSAT